MEQQPLGDRSFRALVLFDFSQPDLRPAQEVCGRGFGSREGDEWKAEIKPRWLARDGWEEKN